MIEIVFSLDGEETGSDTEEGGSEEQGKEDEGMPAGEPEARLDDPDEGESAEEKE